MTAPPAAGAERRSGLGYAAATSAVLIWGCSSVLIKQIDGLDGVAIAFFRLWIGAIVTTAVFLTSGNRFTARIWRLSLWGGLTFVADVVLYFVALQHTSVANATVVGALQPLVLLAVAGPLFGERANWIDGAWGAIAIGGAAAVVFGASGIGESSRFGDVIALCSLLAWCAYFVVSKTARTELTSLEYLTGLTVIAAIAITPMPFVLGDGLARPDTEGWLIVTCIACLNGTVGHFLMNWSHEHIPIVGASLLTLGIPVVATATASVVLDETLEVIQIAGMALVVFSLGIVSVLGARRRPGAMEDELEVVAST